MLINLLTLNLTYSQRIFYKIWRIILAFNFFRILDKVFRFILLKMAYL